MGNQKADTVGRASALASALASAATAATQVAHLAEATEATVGIARRGRDRMMEDRRLLFVLLGVLGLGVLIGIVMAMRTETADEPDEPTVETPRPQPVPDAPKTDSTEASG